MRGFRVAGCALDALLVGGWLTVACGCGLLGAGGPPDRLPSGIPGPFHEEDRLVLCLDDLRLDGPASRGTPSEGDFLGLCAAGGREANPCATDDACGRGEMCVCGRCRTPACRSNDDCPHGLECHMQARRCMESCVDDAGCPAGQRCDPTTLGCAWSCDSDAGCPYGEVCSASRGLCASIPCGDTTCSPGRACDLQRRIAEVGEPALVEVGGEWLLWATVTGVGVVMFREPPGGMTGSLAWRSDGAGPVLEPGLRDASVAQAAGGLVLVAGDEAGTAIHAFEGVDGIAWSPLGDGTALVASETGWEAGLIGRPSIAAVADGWLVS